MRIRNVEFISMHENENSYGDYLVYNKLIIIMMFVKLISAGQSILVNLCPHFSGFHAVINFSGSRYHTPKFLAQTNFKTIILFYNPTRPKFTKITRDYIVFFLRSNMNFGILTRNLITTYTGSIFQSFQFFHKKYF